MQRSIGLEIAASAKILSIETDATGTNWVQLADEKCNQVILYNNTGTALRVAYCAPDDGADRAGESFLTVADGIAQRLRGIQNARQVKIKRSDESNTQVTAKYVTEGVSNA